MSDWEMFAINTVITFREASAHTDARRLLRYAKGLRYQPKIARRLKRLAYAALAKAPVVEAKAWRFPKNPSVSP